MSASQAQLHSPLFHHNQISPADEAWALWPPRAQWLHSPRNDKEDLRALGLQGWRGLTYWFLIMSALLLFIYLPSGSKWDEVLTAICETDAPSKRHVNLPLMSSKDKGFLWYVCVCVFYNCVALLFSPCKLVYASHIGSQLISPRSLQTIPPLPSPLSPFTSCPHLSDLVWSDLRADACCCC